MIHPTTPLKNILCVSGRSRAGDQDLPILSITMKHGLVDQSDKFKKRIASSNTKNYRIALKNELVVGFPIDEGVIGFQTKYPAGIVSPAYNIWKLKCPSRTHIPYLERYLRSDQAKNLYVSRMQGAVARRRSLTKKDFLDLEIPLPVIDEQRKIVVVLGKVEALIAQRKQHLVWLDDLLKSVFFDMFGDPVRNPYGFPERGLPEFYITPKDGTKCGPFGSALKKDELVESGIPVWNMDNIAADGRMALPFRMWVATEKFEQLSAYAVVDGDILISRAGTVGKMCVARIGATPSIISTNLIRLRLNEKLNPLYFVSLMLYCKGRVGRLKTGPDGTFTHMSTKVLDSIKFPYPPLERQHQFLNAAQEVARVKASYCKSLTELETLYAALSQKAFKGELDLSRVPFTQVIEPEPISVGAVGSAQLTVTKQPQGDLPAYEELTKASERAPLLTSWLKEGLWREAGATFDINRVVDAAQARLTAAFPHEDEIALTAEDYETIKRWTFEQLGNGKLTQSLDEDTDTIRVTEVQD